MGISNRELEHNILNKFGVEISFMTVYRIKNDMKKHQSGGKIIFAERGISSVS